MTRAYSLMAGLLGWFNLISPSRRLAQLRHANIVSWSVYDGGGHYAAHQASDVLVDDMRASFLPYHRAG